MGKGVLPLSSLQFRLSGDQTTNLIYRITDSGIPAQTDPKLCIVMIGTNNTGYFKGGEAPGKNRAWEFWVPLNNCQA